jgi:transposase InsO family protein
MNIHKNARLTVQGRKTLVDRIVTRGLQSAAADAGISERTARKWLARYRAEGEAGLLDRSSRPRRVRTALTTEQQDTAVALRGERLTIRVIAARLERPVSTVRRWLAGQGMSRLPPLDPPPPLRRYEHAAPGDLLHLDIKKLGRIVRPGHRVTGNPRDSVDGAGWECVHVAIDDHSRVGFSHAYPDETAGSAITFLRAAVAYYAGLGITIQRLLTDNGAAYRSKAFAAVCRELGIKQRFTRPYTPRTNGKAERFIQTALREWAYATTYSTSADRQAALQPWMHRYNHHRPHSALGYLPPISRIPRNNVSNLNT